MELIELVSRLLALRWFEILRWFKMELFEQKCCSLIFSAEYCIPSKCCDSLDVNNMIHTSELRPMLRILRNGPSELMASMVANYFLRESSGAHETLLHGSSKED